jgi:hypothetical protein
MVESYFTLISNVVIVVHNCIKYCQTIVSAIVYLPNSQEGIDRVRDASEEVEAYERYDGFYSKQIPQKWYDILE